MKPKTPDAAAAVRPVAFSVRVRLCTESCSYTTRPRPAPPGFAALERISWVQRSSYLGDVAAIDTAVASLRPSSCVTKRTPEKAAAAGGSKKRSERRRQKYEDVALVERKEEENVEIKRKRRHRKLPTEDDADAAHVQDVAAETSARQAKKDRSSSKRSQGKGRSARGEEEEELAASEV